MSASISAHAGKLAPVELLVDVPKLLAAYIERPDPAITSQRVVFGTSGHRGSSFERSFNEWHVLAITQAVCDYRKHHHIDGPLFIGIDTHALSQPAFESALSVLAANGVETLIAKGGEFTPTPVISHAILTYNRERRSGWADGIVITPSHNPPDNGGFKYNLPHGGPADTHVTNWIQERANILIEKNLNDVQRITYAQACHATTTHEYDFLTHYVAELDQVLDLDAIRSAGLHMAVDPLGGAGVHYWARIAELYRLDLTVVSEQVDPTFRFMTVDWDGQIRMDPSSAYAMQRLITLKDHYDIAFACDTDHDRHGIVTRSSGLLPPNHYLCVMIDYLFGHRPQWHCNLAVGKTIVSSAMIDRVAARLGRPIYEVPVGFKWFVDGLLNSTLSFAGEESAGASFSRLNGKVWTTDKDGIVPSLLSAEIMACTGLDPAELYNNLVSEFGEVFSSRVDAAATPQQKTLLSNLSSQNMQQTKLAGESIQDCITRAPGNDEAIGGLKVIAKSGWFAVRPSGTENIIKIYAESFRGTDHLQNIIDEAKAVTSVR